MGGKGRNPCPPPPLDQRIDLQNNLKRIGSVYRACLLGNFEQLSFDTLSEIKPIGQKWPLHDTLHIENLTTRKTSHGFVKIKHIQKKMFDQNLQKELNDMYPSKNMPSGDVVRFSYKLKHTYQQTTKATTSGNVLIHCIAPIRAARAGICQFTGQVHHRRKTKSEDHQTRPLPLYKLLVAVLLGCTSTGRVGLWFCGSMSLNSRRLNRQVFWF